MTYQLTAESSINKHNIHITEIAASHDSGHKWIASIFNTTNSRGNCAYTFIIQDDETNELAYSRLYRKRADAINDAIKFVTSNATAKIHGLKYNREYPIF